MANFETSYYALFSRTFESGLKIKRIEIPLIQRDFAQGRLDPKTNRIRQNFLEALIGALTEGPPLSLDFVYGDTDGNVLLPLDGQQRLTTLFLLHWYLAARCGSLDDSRAWTQFTYATRASARLFCERLGSSQPDLSQDSPSSWLTDQPWFLQTWQYDPTIQSMLVVLDDIHRCFSDKDYKTAWQHLTNVEAPFITFHVLPMKDLGLSDDIYIKMNSRGKPLTEFELFKARFEKLLETSSPADAETFSKKIDTDWADVFWRPAPGDGVVDREMVRYIRFVTDLCVWNAGAATSLTEDLEALAARTYGPLAATAAAGNIAMLLSCLDTWIGENIATWFSGLLIPHGATTRIDVATEGPLVLFTERRDCNLFAACCRSYDRSKQGNEFGWPEILLLYATLLHRLHTTDDIHRRMRIVRNLIEGSENELRADRIPSLLRDVRRIIVEGTLSGISAFNQRIHVADEQAKLTFLEANPQLQAVLFDLEDHLVLRGCLVVFDLDATTLGRRASAFKELFATEAYLPLITGALLAAGDYSVLVRNRFLLFGSSHSTVPWRDLFRAGTRRDMASTRDALGQLLDYVADRGQASIPEALRAFMAQWLAKQEEAGQFDWRYHFVRYPVMREGVSGRYAGINGRLGYSVCMLDKQQMNSYYRDPYLHAIRLESGVQDSISDRFFQGYEWEPRWLPLKRSGIALRVLPAGFEFRIPSTVTDKRAEIILANIGATVSESTWTLKLKQQASAGELVDTLDRVKLGAEILRRLVEAGF